MPALPFPSCHDCASAQGLRVASLCNLLDLEKVWPCIMNAFSVCDVAVVTQPSSRWQRDHRYGSGAGPFSLCLVAVIRNLCHYLGRISILVLHFSSVAGIYKTRNCWCVCPLSPFPSFHRFQVIPHFLRKEFLITQHKESIQQSALFLTLFTTKCSSFPLFDW